MKKIAILGSTGSIGKSLLKVINKNKLLYKVELITAHKNHNELLKQAKLFNVKNVILTDTKSYNLNKKYFLKNKINIFNDFYNFDKIFHKKINYVMSSIVCIEGLLPTIQTIKFKKYCYSHQRNQYLWLELIQKELKNIKPIFYQLIQNIFLSGMV